MYCSAYYALKGGGGDYFHIYRVYDIHIIFSYNFILILSGLKYSVGLVPFIVHPVINIRLYMHVYTFCRIFHFRDFVQPPSSRPSCCTYHKLSPRELNFAYRVSLMCTRSINNIPYIKYVNMFRDTFFG